MLTYKICVICKKKVFKPYAESRKEFANRKYCSLNCRYISQRKSKIGITCKACNKIFYVLPYRAKKPYCSIKCSNIGRIGNKWTPVGDKNCKWRGDGAGYESLHRRVYRQRGRPQKCEICGTTTAKHYDWANITGRYNDIWDYKRLCRLCHNRRDKGCII